MKNFFILIWLLTVFSCLSGEWIQFYDKAVKEADRNESPLLIFFYGSDKNSTEFNALIERGNLDFLQKTFILCKIENTTPEGLNFSKMINSQSVPLFILEEHEPTRKKSFDPIGIEPLKLFTTIYEVYTWFSSEFLKKGDHDAAYASLKIIENMPESFGVQVKKELEKVAPDAKKTPSVKEINDNFSKAESYFTIADNNMKSENYEKAIIYYKKVIELSPGTDLAKSAEQELKKAKKLTIPE
ncbi:MAG: thioredoxin family protein [Candidatus Delongbacteria bacterium]|nr:thioredoxin family protein [Candidatus Delongbacteria bacterium]